MHNTDHYRGRALGFLVSTVVFSTCLSHLAAAQSADAIVVQAMRAGTGSSVDMICEERVTISNFVKGALTSRKLEEAIVSTPRFVQGVLDPKSSFRELLRVDGKPVPKTDSNGATTNMTEGGAFLGSTSGWVFTQRASFDFRIAGSEALDGSTEKLLVLQFQRKAGSEAGWWVPNSGTFWLDPDSKRLVRVQLDDEDLSPMFSGAAKRTFIEDFGTFTIDGQERWLVKTRNHDHYPDKSIQSFTRRFTEYSNCKRFGASVTFRPVP